MNIPILVDAERRREGLDDLLNLASYVVCSEKFPQVSGELNQTLRIVLGVSIKQLSVCCNLNLMIYFRSGLRRNLLQVRFFLCLLNCRA